jgi:formate--tetrahydrofolate ligase
VARALQEWPVMALQYDQPREACGDTQLSRRPIQDVARELGVPDEDLEPYGRWKAKVSLRALEQPARGAGRLVLVSAVTPTAAGEGKTTTAIALAMALRQSGKRAVLALRQPSLGPIFGIKGGATGGGRAVLVPSDDINVHFTGDLHAVGAAHNLLSSMIDNALHWRERFGDAELDPRRIAWGRVLDSEDRSLRHCVVGLGGAAHGVPREERFDITAASEVMAILALAHDRVDLQARLARIIAGSTNEGIAVTAGDLRVAPAMAALLRDALLPNLVQTAEGGPALVHAGPFANIAHGCSSVLATRLALQLGDYAITEAGFGFDLGGEKFLDIKCRVAGVWPRLVVLVTTLRALRARGGSENLDKHLESIAAFGLPVVVAVNVMRGDVRADVESLVRALGSRGIPCAASEGYEHGGEGALELARLVAATADGSDASPPAPRFLYPLDASPMQKARAIATTVYGARDVALTPAAEADLARAGALGGDRLPLCFAKTHLSLSDDAHAPGRPRDFVVTVREVRLAAGAGMLVALTGDMTTMPGLPRDPHARRIHLGRDGEVAGL